MQQLNPERVRDTIQCVRDIISNGWCQDIQAMDSVGNKVSPYDEHATNFCLTGAFNYLHGGIQFDSDDVSDAARNYVVRYLEDKHLGNSLIEFNDKYAGNRLAVVELLDGALADFDARFDQPRRMKAWL
jgi:hypothetical protein